jgi:hypothetical protein
VAQVVEYLPGKSKALSSNISITKKIEIKKNFLPILCNASLPPFSWLSFFFLHLWGGKQKWDLNSGTCTYQVGT